MMYSSSVELLRRQGFLRPDTIVVIPRQLFDTAVLRCSGVLLPCETCQRETVLPNDKHFFA